MSETVAPGADNLVSMTQADFDRVIETRLARDRQARVVNEWRTYALDSPHSYYLDAVLTRLDPQGITYPSAHERMRSYAVEAAEEVRARSPEGRYIERALREHTRVEDRKVHQEVFERRMKEIRAVTSGGGSTASGTTSLAAFVPPYFLVPEFALFRANYRAFADQCHALPLPAYGMEVYVPFFASATGASQQTEASGVTEVDPSTSLQGTPIVTQAGQVTITQQVRDRLARGGGTADVIFSRQLQQDLAAKVDLYALNQVITGGNNIPGAASLTANSWKEVYQDIAKGREGLTDTAGVRLRPTHLFTTYDLYSGLTSIMGTDGKPMQLPVFMPGFPIATGADDGLNGAGATPKWSRFTGTVLPGGVLWFTDDNIPASGSNTQLIVSAPDEAVLILENDPILAIFPETFASSLGIVVSLYEYVSVITRHASGTSIVTGNAYPTTLK